MKAEDSYRVGQVERGREKLSVTRVLDLAGELRPLANFAFGLDDLC